MPAFFSFSAFLTHLNWVPRLASLNGLSSAVYIDSSATVRASAASRSRRAAALASFLTLCPGDFERCRLKRAIEEGGVGRRGKQG